MAGKVVLFNFWSPDCGAAMQQLPELKALLAKYRDAGLEIVGFCVGPDRSSLGRTIQDEALTWPNYFPEQGFTNQFVIDCGVFGRLDNFLIDRQGKLREVLASEHLEKKVELLLSERPREK
jgi:hypothetical protein